MKRALFVLLLVAVVAGLTGCVQDQMCVRRNASAPCNVFANTGGVYDGLGYNPYDPAATQSINPGPPTGAITYPYYTTRGPRDFLARGVRPIGP